jgi:hypothetical protein
MTPSNHCRSDRHRAAPRLRLNAGIDALREDVDGVRLDFVRQVQDYANPHFASYFDEWVETADLTSQVDEVLRQTMPFALCRAAPPLPPSLISSPH